MSPPSRRPSLYSIYSALASLGAGIEEQAFMPARQRGGRARGVRGEAQELPPIETHPAPERETVSGERALSSLTIASLAVFRPTDVGLKLTLTLSDPPGVARRGGALSEPLAEVEPAPPAEQGSGARVRPAPRGRRERRSRFQSPTSGG